MGLLILIVEGAVLGWLAAIVTHEENGRRTFADVLTGIGGSLLAGIVVNKGSVIAGISPSTVLAGLAGAVAALAILNLVRNQVLR
ncbi:MAG: GlsB/YeaQ/YmgE family stress response membrane protein [Sphingomonadales bacterium]|nr:GlsB/YeaQ/YmgE family stress response membrane protein [Sphingomonadales bacterium]MBD3775292.1 GlsB/YeaQ/YmgE family stress response membrane protein [Paracoccaceae bacterium]